jgi:hypothetical protein
LFIIAGMACAVDALTTAYSVWLSFRILILLGATVWPAIPMLLALLGLYDFAVDVIATGWNSGKRDEG